MPSNIIELTSKGFLKTDGIVIDPFISSNLFVTNFLSLINGKKFIWTFKFSKFDNFLESFEKILKSFPSIIILIFFLSKVILGSLMDV